MKYYISSKENVDQIDEMIEVFGPKFKDLTNTAELNFVGHPVFTTDSYGKPIFIPLGCVIESFCINNKKIEDKVVYTLYLDATVSVGTKVKSVNFIFTNVSMQEMTVKFKKF